MADNQQTLSTNTAAVVEQSLMAFGAGMSYQSRTDAKNTFQFASLVASKKYNEESESEAWFDEFLKVMGDCGWGTAQRKYERETASSQQLTLGAVAFKVFKGMGTLLVGGPLGAALNSLAQGALEKLGMVTEAQDVFKRNVSTKSSAVVGLASCIETSSGEMVLGMSALTTGSAQHDLDVVVFEWKSTSREYYAGMAMLVFNKTLYDYVRSTVESKLGERTKTKVLDYDI